MKKQISILITCLTLMATMAGSAWAAVIIPVENPGFEDQPGGSWEGTIPGSLTPVPNNGITDWWFEWGWASVRASSNPGVTGTNALLMGQNNGGRVYQFIDPSYTVQADSTYTFSAMVGKYSSGNPGVGARLRMVFTTTPNNPSNGYFGADPITFDSSTLDPASTTLETLSMTIDSGANPSLVGRYIAIGLDTIGTGDWNNYQTWDNVSLEYTVVPEPATFAMLLGGLGTLTLLRRRSRTA